MVWHAANLGFPMGEAHAGRTDGEMERGRVPVAKYNPCPMFFLPQFKCCGWNNYTDWSWNLYFNCTQENPSYERCAVPYSCCIPIPGEVREVFFFSLLLALAL